MTEPSTRPGEISRIAQSEIEFRVRVLTGIERMDTQWNIHLKDNERQFSEINRRIDELKGNVNIVTSKVGEGERYLSKLDGVRLAVTAFWIMIAAGVTWAITGGWWKK